MNKLIVIFFLLNILNIYCQLSCSQYTDSTCGGYTSFKLKCHKSGSNCVEIEVDDGCTINDSNQCDKEEGVTLGENEICFNYGVATKCRRIKDQCTSYIDSDCGGKKGTIIGSLQCTKMSDNAYDFCTEIEIDNYCQLNDSNQCVKKSTVNDANFDKQYSCSFNEDKTTCKREAKVCSTQSINSCGDMMPLDTSKKCKKVENVVKCKEIKESDGCTVQSDGSCKGTPANANQKCGFDNEITTCGPIPKTCVEFESNNCSGKPVKLNGKTCYKITSGGASSCEEVEIDEENCEINNGECKAPGDTPTHECILDVNNYCRKKTCEDYDSENCSGKPVKSNGKTCYKITSGGTSSCEEVEIDGENCEINNGVCKAPGDTPTHECILDLNNYCRKKTCEETTATTLAGCKAIQLSQGITCSGVRDGDGKCKEVTIHEKCDIAAEDATPPFDCIDNNLNDENQKCDFTEDKTECKPRPKTCEEYKTDCNGKTTLSADKTTCYKFTGETNCKEVKIEAQCRIDDDDQKCKLQSSVTSGSCDFNANKDECNFKRCNEISQANCEKAQGCGYYSKDVKGCREVKVGENCKISNGACLDDGGNTDTMECLFDYEITECKKRNKKCSSYFENNCGDIQINEATQCYKFSNSNYCREIQVDEKCNVNNNEECVERSGATGIPEDKICHFTDDTKTSCKLVDKECKDYTTQTCKDLTYANSNKKCFYYSDSGRCHEVELDNYCTVDQDGDCVEKDDSLSDTETCGYTNSSETECKKRNMVCNELDIDICESYTPINNKFCFNFGSGGCTEVTVEDGCQMNSANQCVAKRKGDACSLDDNNSRCYKTKSGASLLNLKLFSLLILFFIC